MNQFTVNGVNYIGVEVPESIVAHNCEIQLMDFPFGNEEVHFFLPDSMSIHDIPLPKPSGNYELVGLVKDLKGIQIQQILGNIPDWMNAPVSEMEAFTNKMVSFASDYNLTDNTLIIKVI